MSYKHTDKKSTAYHETAHFITWTMYFNGSASKLNWKESALTIAQQEGVYGQFRRPTGGEKFRSSDSVKFSLSGIAAEYILHKEKDPAHFLGENSAMGEDMCTSDAENVLDHLADVFMAETGQDGIIFEELFLPYFLEVIYDLRNNWHMVEQVAKQLLKDETIKGGKLKEIWKNTKNRLIDPI
jgi:hypothetical protein